MSEHLPDPVRAKFPVDPGPWIRVVPAGTTVLRVYPAGGDHPTTWNGFRTWGPTNSRFDQHPEPRGEHRGIGVMYGAVAGLGRPAPYPSMNTGLAEFYQQTRTVAPAVTDDRVAIFRTAGPLALLDLGDTDWITKAGGNAAIFAGPRVQSRKWAREIYAAYPPVQGLRYVSSVVPAGRAVALWQRSRPAIPRLPQLNRPLDGIATEVERATDAIGYEMAWA